MDMLNVIPIDFLPASRTTTGKEEEVQTTSQEATWMKPFLDYLCEGILPTNKTAAREIQYQLARYIIYDDKLYQCGFSQPKVCR